MLNLGKVGFAIIVTLISGAVLGHFSWLLSVEKRLNVEKRVERLEERLEPILIDWLVEKQLKEMGIVTTPTFSIPTEEDFENPRMPEIEAFERNPLREKAKRDVNQWRMEQRTITRK